MNHASDSGTPRPDEQDGAAPLPLAIPGMHEQIVMHVVACAPPSTHPRAVDIGAGQGAFARQLLQAGYQVDACDLFPEMFRCEGVTCRFADLHEPLPFESDQFDLAVSIEVVEHLESQLRFFKEVHRVLKPEGTFIFTTPNIASLKSRLRFLFSGFFYSHGPLDPMEKDAVSQHIAAFTPDRYRFLLGQAALELIELRTDQYQRSSLFLAWLAPLVWLYSRTKFGRGKGVEMENSIPALFGRTMIGIAKKVK